MINWAPHTLQHCLDSAVLAYSTASLAFGTLVWYGIIAFKWFESMRHSSDRARKTWMWLATIFVVCATAGYFSWILALVVPKTAVIVRITALATLNVICPVFWGYARRKSFSAINTEQHIGEQLVEGAPSIINMTDHEIAILTRKILANSVEEVSAAAATLAVRKT